MENSPLFSQKDDSKEYAKIKKVICQDQQKAEVKIKSVVHQEVRKIEAKKEARKSRKSQMR